MAPAAPVHCPRCAYDLSGETARWDFSCPLAGTCPECGGGLDWRALFRPDLARTPWFFEHTRGVARGLIALLATGALAINPLFFWSRVRFEAPVRLGRAMAWLAIVLLTPRVLGSALNSLWLGRMSSLAAQRLTPTSIANVWLDGLAWVDLRARPLLYGSDLVESPPMIVPLVLASIAPGLMLLGLPWTLGASRVRAAHVIRATIYSLAWLAPLGAMYVLRAAGRVWAVMSAGSTPAMGADLEGPLARAVQLVLFRKPAIISALLAVWLLTWWIGAVVVHFRVVRPARLLCLLTLVACLAAIIGLMLNERLEDIVRGL